MICVEHLREPQTPVSDVVLSSLDTLELHLARCSKQKQLASGVSVESKLR